MINCKAGGIRIIPWLCWAQYRVEDKCSNLVLVQIALLSNRITNSALVLTSLTSDSQLVDNLPFVIGGHWAPELTRVTRLGLENQEIVTSGSSLHSVLSVGLDKKITISSRLDLVGFSKKPSITWLVLPCQTGSDPHLLFHHFCARATQNLQAWKYFRLIVLIFLILVDWTVLEQAVSVSISPQRRLIGPSVLF